MEIINKKEETEKEKERNEKKLAEVKMIIKMSEILKHLSTRVTKRESLRLCYDLSKLAKSNQMSFYKIYLLIATKIYPKGSKKVYNIVVKSYGRNYWRYKDINLAWEKYRTKRDKKPEFKLFEEKYMNDDKPK